MKYLVLICMFVATQAFATKAREHCEPKTPEPPAKSAPEPRASSNSRSNGESGKPCDRAIDKPVWCIKTFN